MVGNGLSLAVWIGGQIYLVRFFRGAFKVADNFSFTPDRDVLGGKIIDNINTKGFHRQVDDMANRGLDGKIFTKIFLQGPGLGRRLNNDQ